jgi:secreted trypsin-like serine protease
LPNELPWVAGLFKQNKLYCGATIVTNKYLLTAAHCVSNFEPHEIRVCDAIILISIKIKIKSINRHSSAVTIFRVITQKLSESSALLPTKISTFLASITILRSWKWNRQFFMVLEPHQLACRVAIKRILPMS